MIMEPLEELDDVTELFAVRTTAGREEMVLDRVVARILRLKIDVLSVLAPKQLKGYIVVEARELAQVEDAVRGIQYARSVVRRPIAFDEVKHFLTATPTKINIQKGDLVELVSGPFKAEKAKVSRVDKVKQEVTVELVQAAVAIPVTVKVESVRLEERPTQQKEEIDDAENNS